MALALPDSQMRMIAAAARRLAPEKRAAFLERLAAQVLHLTGGYRPSDADIARAMKAALKGLLHSPVV